MKGEECLCAEGSTGAKSAEENICPSMDGRTETAMGEECPCCDGDVAVVAGAMSVDMIEMDRRMKPGTSKSKVGELLRSAEPEVDGRDESWTFPSRSDD